ncbi:MAG: universal stress protein [Bacteroidetes bacterium]|jgi:nucleotide-binding universal stress UspA family protein|nr:universal stress protein [Bacteroidota bacterium]
MKNVLVLTDFSQNSYTAAEAGLLLAGKLHTDLFLFHTYINYETITSYGGGGWIVDEYTERKHQDRIGLQTMTEGLESISSRLDPEDRKPAINSESNDSDLGLDVADLIHRKNIELIVMGARSNPPEEIGFGADTNAVMEYATRPVLITPGGTDLRKIHKILFATDFEKGDIEAVHYMARLAKLFYWKLEIVHVCDSGHDHCSNKEADFKNHLEKLDITGLNYQEINGKDVVNRIHRFLSNEPETILAMVHVQNSFLVRLFQHSLVRKALVNQKTPLLIFPSKMYQ